MGPAREGPSEDQIKEVLAKRAAQLGTGGTFAGTEKKEENDNEEEIQNQDPENEVGLFATGAYDREDDEADRIYQTVDERMEKRRKQRRLVFFRTSPAPFLPFSLPMSLSHGVNVYRSLWVWLDRLPT